MKVVITSATEKEAILIKQAINPVYTDANLSSNFSVLFHVSGVGMLSSCFSISRLIFEKSPDFFIQAGIAGAFGGEFDIGKVVAIKDEVAADAGVEENGQFNDLFDLNLSDQNAFPFLNKKLFNANIEKLNYLKLDLVSGITVNEITTRQERIAQYRTKYDAFSESMEGASLHYSCLQTSTPFIQIRAISNRVGERDKSKWQLKESIENLANVVLLYIDHLRAKNEI